MTQSLASDASGIDRRTFFRIDDQVALTYRRLADGDPECALQELQQRVTDSFNLAAAFAGIGQETRLLHQQISQELPSVALYLDALERKLEVLAQIVLRRNADAGEKDIRPVNLSAGGMEFQTGEILPPGSLLELRFVVFPSHVAIAAGARVARCDADAGPGGERLWHVGVEFLYLRESDRQFLVRHVLNRQSQRLREGRHC
ncbi:MAG: PilZ domain-containing protein [Pseudomonadota bacterium]|nr:PilZ domain-containing protein [Pseudomonadota bacterium]